jgi:hypothetical protein
MNIELYFEIGKIWGICMKFVRKSLSIVLALILSLGVLSVLGSAEVANGAILPNIIVHGGTQPLYYKDTAGTAQQTNSLGTFQISLITEPIQAKLPTLLEYAKKLNINGVVDLLIEAVNEALGEAAFGGDGEPLVPMDGDLRSINNQLSASYTGRNYDWWFDWRRSPCDLADDLDVFIEKVKIKNHVDKVNLYTVSGSGGVGPAYLDEYGTDDLNAYFGCISMGNGTTWFGGLANKQFLIEGDAGLNCALVRPVVDSLDVTIDQKFDTILNGNGTGELGEATQKEIKSYQFLAKLIDILTDLGIMHTVTGTLNLILKPQILERLYNEAVVPTLFSIPGIWTYVPAETYDSGIKACFDYFGGREGKYKKLIEKFDEFHNVQKRSNAILAKAAQEIRVGIYAVYGSSQVPLVRGSNMNGDTQVDLVYASFGATTKAPGERLDTDKFGKPKAYKQIVDDGYNHISPDGEVDASTCILPNNTWIVKGGIHGNHQNYYPALRNWFFDYEGPNGEWPDVHTDERFPQFMTANVETWELTPMEKTEPQPMNFWEILLEILKTAVRWFNYLFTWWLDLI